MARKSTVVQEPRSFARSFSRLGTLEFGHFPATMLRIRYSLPQRGYSFQPRVGPRRAYPGFSKKRHYPVRVSSPERLPHMDSAAGYVEVALGETLSG